MDVHNRSVSVCAYDPETAAIIDERQLPHDVARVRKYVHRLQQRHGPVACCYEASSCGFGLQRALQSDGLRCEVIVPSSIPRRSGDRVKTDRRDAQRLASLYAADMFTPVCVPDEAQEAVRSLLRCRTDLVLSITQTKQRTLSFIQTRGYQYKGVTLWTKANRAWLEALPVAGVDQVTLQTYLHKLAYLEQEVRRLEDRLAQEATQDRYRDAVNILMAFRGIGLVTAMTLICEFGSIDRFAHPRLLMAYFGLVPSEYSSGDHRRRGSITKASNTHARKALVSTARKYARPPRCSQALRERQQAVSADIVALSWKAQQRLFKRFLRLSQTKPRNVAAVAVARELVGFLWEALHLAQCASRPKAA